jgi:hypothetical protein
MHFISSLQARQQTSARAIHRGFFGDGFVQVLLQLVDQPGSCHKGTKTQSRTKLLISADLYLCAPSCLCAFLALSARS